MDLAQLPFPGPDMAATSPKKEKNPINNMSTPILPALRPGEKKTQEIYFTYNPPFQFK